MIYNTKYFTEFFSAIPDEKWIVGGVRGPNGQLCALGHTYDGEEGRARGQALVNLFDRADLLVSFVNDNGMGGFDQPTPKGRILAALHHIEMGS